MINSLDQTSRNTVGRFALKFSVSTFVACIGKVNFFDGMLKWLMLYAILTMGIAIICKQRFPSYSFNHWDETLWLAAAAMGLRFIHKVLL